MSLVGMSRTNLRRDRLVFSICSPSRPFHSALKRQLKAEKKAKDKETKLAQAAADQKETVRDQSNYSNFNVQWNLSLNKCQPNRSMRVLSVLRVYR